VSDLTDDALREIARLERSARRAYRRGFTSSYEVSIYTDAVLGSPGKAMAEAIAEELLRARELLRWALTQKSVHEHDAWQQDIRAFLARGEKEQV